MKTSPNTGPRFLFVGARVRVRKDAPVLAGQLGTIGALEGHIEGFDGVCRVVRLDLDDGSSLIFNGELLELLKATL